MGWTEIPERLIASEPFLLSEIKNKAFHEDENNIYTIKIHHKKRKI